MNDGKYPHTGERDRADVNHRLIDTNGISMHIAEQGEGSLVVLCHGFPECWYPWRHQLPALAEAGYHVVAPDQRGYGGTSRPEPVEAYHTLQLTGDMVGLVRALGEERAIIVGHDWGAPVAWHCALLRPDMFHAVALLSVPYLMRSWTDLRPTEAMQRMAGEQEFYQLYFQEPGQAEAEQIHHYDRWTREGLLPVARAGCEGLVLPPGDQAATKGGLWRLSYTRSNRLGRVKIGTRWYQ
jgi:pimeloyl-ACP methyl ester carboxylesterase